MLENFEDSFESFMEDEYPYITCATIVLDSYKIDETKLIANALNNICSPNNNGDWASSGIYCFWNYYTKEIYYIGLAIDLAERFKQHNGLIKSSDETCKNKYINEYFKTNEKLGYTIFLQSPFSQPITRKNKKNMQAPYFNSNGKIENSYESISNESMKWLKFVEGSLIESFKIKNNRLPLWNKIGGLVKGQRNKGLLSKYEEYKILNCFTLKNSNLFISKYSLRNLSQNTTYLREENSMHAIRCIVIFNKFSSFKKAFEIQKQFDTTGIFEYLESSEYSSKVLII